MKYIASIIFALSASPALAASGPFVSLRNTDFVVLVAFLIFIGILLFYKVPTMIAKMLDERADAIKADLDEARALREEAQSLLASYERKHKDVQEQADQIVSSAKAEAEKAAKQAQTDIETSVARRLASAEEQIQAAQAAAVKDVRNQAIAVSIAAAQDILTQHMDAKKANILIETSIEDVATKMH